MYVIAAISSCKAESSDVEDGDDGEDVRRMIKLASVGKRCERIEFRSARKSCVEDDRLG